MRLSEDILITPTLLRRFELEGYGDGGDGRHYARLLRPNGALASHHPGSPQLAPHQIIWADDVLRLLNREIDHGGAWVVVFTHVHVPPADTVLHDTKHLDYRRYCLIWLDQDGDAQFTVEWTHGEGELYAFEDVMLAGPQSTAQKCEAAWEAWHMLMRQVIQPREGQTFKRAQGQLPRIVSPSIVPN